MGGHTFAIGPGYIGPDRPDCLASPGMFLHAMALHIRLNSITQIYIYIYRICCTVLCIAIMDDFCHRVRNSMMTGFNIKNSYDNAFTVEEEKIDKKINCFILIR